MNEHYEKWNQYSPLGLLLMGFGLSLVGNATISKSKGRGWILKGTLALIVFNAGAAIFGEAIKARTLYELELRKLQS
jgi:hypothetical protein